MGDPKEERDAINLAEILTLYLAWFGSEATEGRHLKEETLKKRGIPSGESWPDIVQIEDLTRDFLNEALTLDVPVHFGLSVIESIAYITSQFAAADWRNGPLYRAAALRILKEGLDSISVSES